MTDPLRKLSRVRYGGWQEHIVDIVRKKNYRLFPHHASLLVSHVVDLVKYNPAHFSHDLWTTV